MQPHANNLKAVQLVLQNAGLYTGDVDGIPGKLTSEAFDKLSDLALSEYRANKAGTPVVVTGPANLGEVDERSAKNIKTLHEKLQPIAVEFLKRLNGRIAQGTEAKIISGTRTYEEQNALYAKGRTAPGPKVTNARGGYSNHNFGVAFDIGFFRGGKYISDGPEYDVAGKVGKELGLEWGGDWTSIVDKPHFQYRTGLTVAQMRERVAAGKAVIS